MDSDWLAAVLPANQSPCLKIRFNKHDFSQIAELRDSHTTAAQIWQNLTIFIYKLLKFLKKLDICISDLKFISYVNII